MSGTGPNPPVTWLLPVKNGMPYLPETLASIAAQTYSHFSILAWDNDSTDGTRDVLHDWIPARIPGRVIDDQPLSLGLTLAGLVNESSTEFCARIDGDDVNLPDRLAKQVEFMTEHPETGVVGTQVQLIDSEGQAQGEWSYKFDDAECRWLTRWITHLCHPSVLFRRSVVLAAGNYREVTNEDSDLWFRLSSYAEIRNMPETLLRYRRFANSATGRVTDWLPIHRRIALINATLLFPNIADAERAMAFWDLTYPHRWSSDQRVKIGDFKLLEGAAIRLARQFW